MPFQPNPVNTFLFLAIFILAFFPGLFNYLLLLPLYPLRSAFSTPQPTPTATPACTCHHCHGSASQQSPPTMSWFQKQFTLPSKSRGSYLITDEVVKQVPEIGQYKVGLLNLFVQHTSCALSLNENWDSDVRYVEASLSYESTSKPDYEHHVRVKAWCPRGYFDCLQISNLLICPVLPFQY